MKCIAVPKKKAEEVRKMLIEKNLLIKNFKIKRNNKYVYFPIKKDIDIDSCFITEEIFEKKEKKSYDKLLKEKGIELKSISIDIIGDIAVIRLKNYEKLEEIAKAIMEANRNVRVVCIDKGIEDEYRIRKIEIIYGCGTETIHREYGLKMKLDISKVYFSPRLSMERKRIAMQVKENEIVIDMFAGIAPFSLVIAKFSKPKKIYAIDKNPYAVNYAIENVKMNKMQDIIEVIEGDARKILPKLPHANHIIMNLPHKSHEFFDIAIEKGKCIHYYEIIEKNKIKERIERLIDMANKKGHDIEVKDIRAIGSYSPSKEKYGIDIEVK